MDNIRVAVRLKPITESQRKITVNGNEILTDGQTYCYDKVFGELDENSKIYDSIASPMVEEALLGINQTIFACKFKYFAYMSYINDYKL